MLFYVSTYFLVCQYVASTRLPLFESADAKDTNEEALNELMKFTKSSQEPEKDKKDKASNRLAERRMTIANMQEEKKKKGSQGDFINLEKQFKVRFQGRLPFDSSQKVSRCVISRGCRG